MQLIPKKENIGYAIVALIASIAINAYFRYYPPHLDFSNTKEEVYLRKQGGQQEHVKKNNNSRTSSLNNRSDE